MIFTYVQNFNSRCISSIFMLWMSASFSVRWVRLKKLHYVDSRGRRRQWEMAERINSRADGSTAANGVGIVAILTSRFDPDNDKIILGKLIGLFKEWMGVLPFTVYI